MKSPTRVDSLAVFTKPSYIADSMTLCPAMCQFYMAQRFEKKRFGCNTIAKFHFFSDAQVRLLARDLAKAARHPVVEERPFSSQRKTGYPRAREKRRNGAFRCYYLPPSQSGKDPGRGRKSVESVKGGMACQSFQIHRHALSGRNRVQPATCPFVNTRWLAPRRS